MNSVVIAKFGGSVIGINGASIPSIIERIKSLTGKSKVIAVFSAPLTTVDGNRRSLTDVALELGKIAEGESVPDLTSIRKKQLNTFQVNDHFINLSMIQKITHGKAYDNDDEVQCFNVEFVYQDGKSEQHEMTYKAFHQLIEKCDDQMTFIVDDYINTVFKDELH